MSVLLPILNLDHFHENKLESFYANDIVNHIKEHHAHIHKPHKHDFYLTVLFTKGNGIHEIDFNRFEVRPGAVFMINPGQIHHWELSEDIMGYVIIHSKDYFDLNYASRSLDGFPFFFSVLNSPHIKIENSSIPLIENYFKLILKEYEADEKYKHQKISSLLDLLYTDLSRLYVSVADMPDKSPSYQTAKLKKLEQLIEEFYLTQKSPKFYAYKMNISTRHLNRIVQNLLNKTTSDLIIDRVLLEAQRLLSSSEITVSELSYHLGYKEPAYLSRVFKKKLSVNPSDFSKKY